MTQIGEPQRIREIEPVVIPVPTPEPSIPISVPEQEPEFVPVGPRRKEDE